VEASRALEGVARPIDTLWRLDGDSLAMVLPDASTQNAEHIARACVAACAGVASGAVPDADERVSVSATILAATARSGSPINLGSVLGCVLRATAAHPDTAARERGTVRMLPCD